MKRNLINPQIEEVSDFWNVLTEEQRIFLKKNSVLHHFKKNQILHRDGDIPNHMMVLMQGKIKIYKEGVGGRSQIIRMLKPIEYFGYRAIFSGSTYNTNAMAFEPSSVFLIPKDVIVRLMQANAALTYFFVKRLSVDLGKSDARIVSLTQKHVRGRLAETLLFLKESYGTEGDGVTISVYLSREDIASLSNMTTSNAIRTLSNFAEEKMIALEGKRIRIIDEKRLNKVSLQG